MNRAFKKSILIMMAICLAHPALARQWTLRECIDYALKNNITLQKSSLTRRSAQEDISQSQAALLPNLTVSTNQNVSYQPWSEMGRATVQNGIVEQSVEKVFYNGSYAINSNWTIWNGNRNRNTIKLDKLSVEQVQADSAITANNIQ